MSQFVLLNFVAFILVTIQDTEKCHNLSFVINWIMNYVIIQAFEWTSFEFLIFGTCQTKISVLLWVPKMLWFFLSIFPYHNFCCHKCFFLVFFITKFVCCKKNLWHKINFDTYIFCHYLFHIYNGPKHYC